MLKQLIQSRNVLLVTLLLLVSSFILLSFNNQSTSTGKDKIVDIKGTLATKFLFTGAPPEENAHTTGVGNISHIGRVVYHGDVTINVQQGQAYNGFATFTAVNGDQFETTYSGPSTEIDGIATGELTHIIIEGSGTGRFKDITGTFVSSIWNDRSTGRGYQNLKGQIVFP